MSSHVQMDNPTVHRAVHYIRMVAIGDLLGLTLIGPAGLGKTHIVEATLKEIGTPFVKYGGHITLAAIYEYLFENFDKLIFFDDCSQLINHKEIMELLKQALSESQTKRTLHYRSYGVRTQAPKEFVFEGRIIMAFNVIEENNPNVLAILSRARKVEMKFNRAEVIKAMYEIAKGPGGGLMEHEKLIVTRELENHTDATIPVNFRDQQQCFKVYLSCKKMYGDPPPPDKWKELVKGILGEKRESWIREMIRDMVGTGKISRKELVRIISIKKDMSPRTAHRRVSEWVEAGEIHQNKLRDAVISIKPFKWFMWSK